MNQATAAIEPIVDRIVALLIERQQAVYHLSACALDKPLPLSIAARHQHIVIDDVGLDLVCELARCDGQSARALHLFALIQLGLDVHLSVATTLCLALPVKALQHLPFHWQSECGEALHLYAQSVLAYRDISQVEHGIAVVARGTIITLMAKETFIARHIPWVFAENRLCN